MSSLSLNSEWKFNFIVIHSPSERQNHPPQDC